MPMFNTNEIMDTIHMISQQHLLALPWAAHILTDK